MTAADLFPRNVPASPLWTFAVAIGAVAAALGLRAGLADWFGDRTALVLFVPPILLGAYVGGMGPGLVATGLVAATTKLFLLPPVGRLAVERAVDFSQWVVLIAIGVMISWTVGPRPASRRTAAPDDSRVSIGAGRVALALVPPLVALALQLAYRDALQYSIWLLLYPAVFLSSWIGGIPGGLLSTVLSAGLVVFVFLDPKLSFAAANYPRLPAIGVFLGMGTLFSFFHDRLRRANLQAVAAAAALQRANAELESRVAQRTNALRASEEFNAAVLDSVATHMAVVDQQGTIVAVNARWRQSGSDNWGAPGGGAGPAEVGDNYLEICRTSAGGSADDAQVVPAGIRAVLDGRLASFSHEYRCDSPGARRWFQLVVTPLGEERRCAVVSHANITELKLVEETLRERERQLLLFIEHAPAAIVMLDRQMRYQFASRRWLEVYRLKLADIVGHSHYEVFPEIPERWKAIHRRCLAGATERCDEDRFPRADGSIEWIKWEVRPWRDDAGEVGGLIIMSESVTERRRAEEALRESEERFRQVVESISEVFWMSDVEKQRIIYASPGYEHIWGRTCAELYASIQSWIESIHPDDRERVLHAARTRQVSGEYDETYRIIRPDGSERWVRDKAFPVKEADGVVRRVVGVAEDITEKRQLEEKFLRTQRLEAVGALSSGIAHDLNNILAPMMMAAGVLRSDLTAPRQRDLLDMIESSAQRGSAIIRQLLTFSRGMEGRRSLVQVRHLIRETAGIIQETFPRNIRLRAHCAADLWPVSADPTQLHQVLMNLCVNARDAMPDGGTLDLAAGNRELGFGDLPRVASAVTEVRPGRYVEISVSDTGQGIPKEIRDRIFEPFFTTKGLGRGTGLGLSTVLGIVRSHGGHIALESEPGQGARFVLLLPAGAAGPAGQDRTEAEAIPPGRGETILVVDDEEPIRVAVQCTLERHGYRVLAAPNGVAGLQAYRDAPEPIRLVLTDLMMPVMDGFRMARTLRETGATVPIIGSSGLKFDEPGNGEERHLLAEILPKPYDVPTLLRTLRRHLPDGTP